MYLLIVVKSFDKIFRLLLKPKCLDAVAKILRQLGRIPAGELNAEMKLFKMKKMFLSATAFFTISNVRTQ